MVMWTLTRETYDKIIADNPFCTSQRRLVVVLNRAPNHKRSTYMYGIGEYRPTGGSTMMPTVMIHLPFTISMKVWPVIYLPRQREAKAGGTMTDIVADSGMYYRFLTPDYNSPAHEVRWRLNDVRIEASTDLSPPSLDSVSLGDVLNILNFATKTFLY